jgi:ABC-type transport system involved in cytochrome c biogenesis permease subunit
MTWNDFAIVTYASAFLWLLGTVLVSFSKDKAILKNTGAALVIAGTVFLAYFIVSLWVSLERPPMRTLGETRLWYSFFLSFIGLLTYFRWGYRWFLQYAVGMSLLFLFINFANPDTHDKTLMPALQSPWFVPHVIVYILAYAFLAASALIGFRELVLHYRGKAPKSPITLADNLVYLGFALLTFGLLFGALWAKEAWGHYWTWDPKETWAFLTWLIYLVYMHYRHHRKEEKIHAMWMLSLSFVILLVAWMGINYLPTANESVHTYSN